MKTNKKTFTYHNEESGIIFLKVSDFPDDVSYFIIDAPNCFEIRGSLFDRFDSLEVVDFSKCRKLRHLGYWLFSGAMSLQKIILPHTFGKKIKKEFFHPSLKDKVCLEEK